MLGKLVLKIQKARINGPFKRVTYIDPYPDRILKSPSFFTTNLLIVLGLFSFPACFIIGFCGANSEIPQSFRNETIVEIGKYIYLQIGSIAGHFQTDRLEVLGILIPAVILLGISLIVMSNWLSRRFVALSWKKKCEIAPAQVLDSEIQEMFISQGPKSKPKSCYTLRIKTTFTFQGQSYETTPSVVNRITPGAICLHYTTRKECENLLTSCQQALVVEFDPQNPLDCEIQGNLDKLLRADKRHWLIICIFGGALFLFSRMFIYILRN